MAVTLLRTAVSMRRISSGILHHFLAVRVACHDHLDRDVTQSEQDLLDIAHPDSYAVFILELGLVAKFGIIFVQACQTGHDNIRILVAHAAG